VGDLLVSVQVRSGQNRRASGWVHSKERSPPPPFTLSHELHETALLSLSLSLSLSLALSLSFARRCELHLHELHTTTFLHHALSWCNLLKDYAIICMVVS
jgi:hypothetical protein